MIFFYILKAQTFAIIQIIDPLCICEILKVLWSSALINDTFVVLGDPIYICNLTCKGTTMECNQENKVWGVTIDDKLTLTLQLENIIKKTNQKLYALSRIKRYMGFEYNKLIMSSFTKSQFRHCPLVWMFCSRTSMSTPHYKRLLLKF